MCMGKWSGRAALRASGVSGPVGGRTVSGWRQWLQWPAITRYIVCWCAMDSQHLTDLLIETYIQIVKHLETRETMHQKICMLVMHIALDRPY